MSSHLERNEETIINRLFELIPELDPQFRKTFSLAFEVLRNLYLIVADKHRDAHQGQIALLGLINHTYNLAFGSLRQLQDGNSHVWSACVRGLIETFGLLVYVQEKPNKLPSVLEHGIPAGKLRAAAERGSPGLGEDIDRLSNIVHPGKQAVYAGFRITNEKERLALFQLGPIKVTTNEATEALLVIANVTNLITQRIRAIVHETPELLRLGKMVAESTDPPAV